MNVLTIRSAANCIESLARVAKKVEAGDTVGHETVVVARAETYTAIMTLRAMLDETPMERRLMPRMETWAGIVLHGFASTDDLFVMVETLRQFESWCNRRAARGAEKDLVLT